jgi:ferredoxin
VAEIVFLTGSGRRVLAVPEPGPDGAPTVLDAVRRVGLPLAQSCRGEGVCRSCVVDVHAGGEHLGAASPIERRFGLDGARRLACQAALPPAQAAAEVVVGSPAWGLPPADDPASSRTSGHKQGATLGPEP